MVLRCTVPVLLILKEEHSVEDIFFIFAKTVAVILGLVSIAMMVRMILPIFVDVEDNRIFALSCLISEPFIVPVRALMFKFNVGQDSPIDWAFFMTYIILWLLRMLLPPI